MNAPESGSDEEGEAPPPPLCLLSPPRRHLVTSGHPAPRECSAPGIAQDLPCPAQPSRPAYMAAGSAFSLLQEFYFFAAIAATSLLEHLFRCFLHLLPPPQTWPQPSSTSAVFSWLDSPVAFVKILTLCNSSMELNPHDIVKIFRRYKISSPSNLKEEDSE